MVLSHLSLQNFRSYSKANFAFDHGTTVIVGPNTAGKSNLMEAIYLLASGKSYRSEKLAMMIQFGKEMGRVKGKVQGSDGAMAQTELEVVLTVGQVANVKAPFAKYLVNGVSKRRVDFAGNLVAVIFSPSDLDIIVGSPSLRREFLDQVLEQISLEYRLAHLQYFKGLRQRNALLEVMRETGKQVQQQLVYWNDVLIKYGNVLSKLREHFLQFINQNDKALFSCQVAYDHSLISQERLLQYKEQEIVAGVTLVGPHRDDFQVHMDNKEQSDIRYFGSRGQQRLAILQLKMLQMEYISQSRGERPLLLLDDIFSELDNAHIKHVSALLANQQTILTTTHEEFIPKKVLNGIKVVHLPEKSSRAEVRS